jgi:hypothetical protein
MLRTWMRRWIMGRIVIRELCLGVLVCELVLHLDGVIDIGVRFS